MDLTKKNYIKYCISVVLICLIFLCVFKLHRCSSDDSNALIKISKRIVKMVKKAEAISNIIKKDVVLLYDPKQKIFYASLDNKCFEIFIGNCRIDDDIIVKIDGCIPSSIASAITINGEGKIFNTNILFQKSFYKLYMNSDDTNALHIVYPDPDDITPGTYRVTVEGEKEGELEIYIKNPDGKFILEKVIRSANIDSKK